MAARGIRLLCDKFMKQFLQGKRYVFAGSINFLSRQLEATLNSSRTLNSGELHISDKHVLRLLIISH